MFLVGRHFYKIADISKTKPYVGPKIRDNLYNWHMNAYMKAEPRIYYHILFMESQKNEKMTEYSVIF